MTEVLTSETRELLPELEALFAANAFADSLGLDLDAELEALTSGAPDPVNPNNQTAPEPDEAALTAEQAANAKIVTDMYREHSDSLTNFACFLTRNRYEAQDLVQDTYLKALRFAGSFTPGTNSQAWLFRIARNTYFDNLRANNTRPQISVHELDPEAPYMCQPSPSPEKEVINRETLLLAFNSITNSTHRLALSAHLLGITGEEGAEMLGVSQGYFRQATHYGRTAAIKALTDRAHREGFKLF